METVTAPTPEFVPEAETRDLAPLALATLHMVSPLEGWATGWTVEHNAGGILRTEDGGAQWRLVSPPGVDPIEIETTFFLDADHAWLVVGASNVAPGTAGQVTIWRTSDGGSNWQAGGPLHLSSAGPGWLYFVDALHGWFMANLEASAGSMAAGVYRTTDGGSHWENVSLTAGDPSLSTPGSLPLPCNKTGISFRDTTTGWATGHCTTGGLFFYITRDAGRTWQPQRLSPPSGSPANRFADCDCETTPPVFASAQNGVAPIKIFTSEHEAVLYATQDGGSTWHASPLATNRLLRPPDFVNAMDGFVTDEVQIYATHDGGQTWSLSADLPQLRLLGTLDFADAHHAWAIGGESMYATGDGGKTWQPVSPVLAGAPAATATPATPSP